MDTGGGWAKFPSFYSFLLCFSPLKRGHIIWSPNCPPGGTSFGGVLDLGGWLFGPLYLILPPPSSLSNRRQRKKEVVVVGGEKNFWAAAYPRQPATSANESRPPTGEDFFWRKPIVLSGELQALHKRGITHHVSSFLPLVNACCFRVFLFGFSTDLKKGDIMAKYLGSR